MCADSKKDKKINAGNAQVSSMTGFGYASIEDTHDRYVAEVRSINSRYAEIRIFGLREDFQLEFEITKKIKQQFERGKFDLTLKKEINAQGQKEDEGKRIKDHFSFLKKQQKFLGMSGDISFETVLRTMPPEKNSSANEEKNHAQFLKVVDSALESLKKSRQHEGVVLLTDIQKRFKLMRSGFEKIVARIPEIRKKRKSEIAEKIQAAVQDLPVDSKRIEGEIALLIEKGDVTEELVRFEKHLEAFEVLLASTAKKKSIGRELDFTLQEMHREINTLGAKISDVDMSKIVVNIKAEMEKIREQVQNIQ